MEQDISLRERGGGEEQDGGAVRRPTRMQGTTPEELPLRHAPPELLGRHVLLGLTIAGVASTILTTVFGLFHVDVFLTAYALPLPTYSLGSFVFSIINTANDLAGAWFVDHIATSMARSDLVGISGCLFAFCFLTPFFRWHEPSKWDGAHFVITMSLYDTMYSFVAILMGSVVTDNHHMSDRARVQFMASGKVANLIASFAVARIGLAVFDADNLTNFRIFLLSLTILVVILFILGQVVITGSPLHIQWRKFRIRRKLQDKMHSDEGAVSPKRKLQWRRVIKDFWQHQNFRAWLGMEMLLEAQVTFASFFLKTFVDGLLLKAGVSRANCDWLLSLIRPLTRVAGILAYVPIRQLGYPRLYTLLFCFNICLAVLLLAVANPTSTYWIIAFLVIYPVFTGAVQSSGFHLAMSDLVMEMKRNHAFEGRHDEPSLAGLFMGANALFCKPMEALLPIVTATVLDKRADSQESLFYLLIIPPLVCSCIQVFLWNRFDLTPKRTASMREELQKLHYSLSDLSEGDVNMVNLVDT